MIKILIELLPIEDRKQTHLLILAESRNSEDPEFNLTLKRQHLKKTVGISENSLINILRQKNIGHFSESQCLYLRRGVRGGTEQYNYTPKMAWFCG